MKPVKINPKQRSGMWNPSRRVWFQKNDDEEHSKWERLQCPHGRFIHQRWTWKKGSNIENSEPEIKRHCKKCREDIV